MNTSSPRIFLSHSVKDHSFCLQLVDDLHHALIDPDAVWYDAQGGLHGGDAWWRKIVQELKSRNTFIVVLSPDAMSSDWVNDEIDIAWRQKNSPARMRLFPVLYRPCEVRTDLENLQIISFVPPKTYEAAFQELLHALGLATSKSSTATQKVSVTPHKTKEQWLNEGDSHFASMQYEQAIADYDRALQLDPQYAEAYHKRALAYFALNKYEQAIVDYDRALQLDPQNAQAFLGRGNVYRDLKQYEQAIADYDRVLILNPKYAWAKLMREEAQQRLRER
jgi:tetratricopeptide (TPR) repeat protein